MYFLFCYNRDFTLPVEEEIEANGPRGSTKELKPYKKGILTLEIFIAFLSTLVLLPPGHVGRILRNRKGRMFRISFPA